MVFTSFSFAIFLPIVFLLYWLVFNKTSKTQNTILLIASILFYSIADWKFISLLASSGFVNYFLAKKITQKEEESKSRRVLFYLGVTFNIGILLYFKYFNFFIQSFIVLFNYNDAININFTPFHILLPLGISFFTFQMIGYLIDVDNEEIEPTNDLLSFFTYLAYFPKILSGPIEKVQNFLPQIQKKRKFNYALAVDGLRQILWGLFKKIVIANNFTALTDTIFNDYQNMPGSVLLLGSIFYIISLYADFSGFSDMACGVSKLFNIKITNNFAFPFFATNISDFWKRWHISLTSWVMNYVYTPLSFITRNYKKFGLIISIILTFLLVGLWHGANWTFVIFGLLHGLYFIPIILKGSLSKKNTLTVNKLLPTFTDFFKMCSVFLLVSVTSIFFRSDNVFEAFSYFKILFSKSFFIIPSGLHFQGATPDPLILFSLTFCFFLIEWFGRAEEFPIQSIGSKRNRIVRWMFYSLIIFLIGMFMQSEESPFIYLQF